jgi:arylsulfatase A-like enzyme
LPTAAASSRPNVVLVTMDTVRADHLSLYGYRRDTTPFLEELANRATVYTNAIATSDFTPPTHASLFTGLYASWHGAHFDPPGYVAGRALPAGHPTLASILAKNGYRTAAVVANWGGLSPRFGLDRGFQLYDARKPKLVTDPRFIRGAFANFLGAFVCTSDLDARFRRAGEINGTVSTVLNHLARERRSFFLFVNYMDAHVPYAPPRRYCNIFEPRASHSSVYNYAALEQRVMTRRQPINAQERAQLVSQYDAGIRYLDSQLAVLFGRLKELGLFDNTLIIVCADHGEAFGARDLMQHGVSVYQDEVHVPLIIKYPHQSEPRVVRDFVSQVDVLPTVLDVIGIEPPKLVQGVDLRAPQIPEGRYLVSESFCWMDKFDHRLERVERAIFCGNLKLITSTRGPRGLYDLELDPHELRDLSGADPDDEEHLGSELKGWVQRIPAPSGGSTRGDERLLNVLRSLGYVQ